MHDYCNWLIEVKEYQTDTWNTVAEYRYDAAGRRVLKVVTNSGDLNGTTRYLWGGQSGWQCLEELDGGDDIVARYTYAPGYIDAVACQERDLNADGDFADSSEVVYYHSTTLYSVYALSDSNESVVERYRYDAYGQATVLDADHSSDADGASDVENPYLYTGRRLDSESGLMQYRHRYYSGGLGRFVSRDPLGYVDGYSLYEYVSGRPLRRTDPRGTNCVDLCPRAGKKRALYIKKKIDMLWRQDPGGALGKAFEAYDAAQLISKINRLKGLSTGLIGGGTEAMQALLDDFAGETMSVGLDIRAQVEKTLDVATERYFEVKVRVRCQQCVRRCCASKKTRLEWVTTKRKWHLCQTGTGNGPPGTIFGPQTFFVDDLAAEKAGAWALMRRIGTCIKHAARQHCDTDVTTVHVD